MRSRSETSAWKRMPRGRSWKNVYGRCFHMRMNRHAGTYRGTPASTTTSMGARGDFGLRINLLRSRVLRDEQRDCYHRRYILMNLALLVLLAVGSPSPDDPVPQQPPPTQNPTAGATSTSSPAVPYERPASWILVIPNLASDQKRIWLFPFKLFKGEDLIPTAAIVATTVGLVALDPYTAPAF